MAEATIRPTYVSAERSRLHTAWLWMRELLRKAGKGFATGASKVQVTIIRAAHTTAAAVISAGTQIGLATRVGWDGAANLATKGLGLVAKGIVQVGRGVSWLMDKVGKGLSWFAGLFSKKAGAAIESGNERFTNWRLNVLGAAYSRIDGVAFFARAAVTSPTASTVGRSYAGVLGVAGIANIATKGAVAAKAVSVIGPKAALLFGPVGLVATAVVGVVAGLFAWLFRRNEVMDNAASMLGMPPVTQVEESDSGPMVVDLTEDGLGADIKGNAAVVDGINADEIAQDAAIAKTLAGQLKAAGMLPVTTEMVEESLRQEGAAPMANGKYSKAAMDKRRKALREGHIPLPAMPEPISA